MDIKIRELLLLFGPRMAAVIGSSVTDDSQTEPGLPTPLQPIIGVMP